MKLIANSQSRNFSLDVALELPEQLCHLAVTGANGSGKSTLLRTIAGLAGKSSFAVRGHRISKFGFVFQHGALFSHLSAYQNLKLAFRHGDQRIDLNEIIARFSLEPLLTQSPLRLSGGQRQRLAIARVFAQSPECILFDEAFSALDWQSKLSVYEECKTLINRYELSSIVVTHANEDIELMSDYCIQLDNGRIARQGTSSAMSEDYFSGEAVKVFSLSGTFTRSEDKKITTLLIDNQPIFSRSPYVHNDTAIIRLESNQLSVSTDRLANTSMVNQLKGRLIQTIDLNSEMLRLVISTGEKSLFCDISKWSFNRLKLKVGQSLWVNFKLL